MRKGAAARRVRRRIAEGWVESEWGWKERFFIYIHTDGSSHLKKFVDPGDLDEMLASDFVGVAYELTQPQWEAWRRAPTGPEALAKKLTDGEVDPRRLPGGVIRQFK